MEAAEGWCGGIALSFFMNKDGAVTTTWKYFGIFCELKGARPYEHQDRVASENMQIAPQHQNRSKTRTGIRQLGAGAPSTHICNRTSTNGPTHI